MFGFPRFGKKPDKTSIPAAASNAMVLVSKEDIYRENRGHDPILLLRKGQEVPPADLPKLIQNGARPEQFRFEYQKNATLKTPSGRLPGSAPEFQRNHSPVPVASNPITAPPRQPVFNERQRKKVLILEPDQKSLKRLIDCLFVCGFDLNRIQPLRIPAHLNWTLERHRPNILIVSYHLSDPQQGIQNGIGLLETIQRMPNVEQIILTLDAPPALPLADEVAMRRFCDEKGIKILYRPFSRFTLNRLLEEEISSNPFTLTPR